MNQLQAYVITSQWGSYQHRLDEGQCFYCLPCNDGRPQNDDHRLQCLNYTKAQISRLETGIAWGTVDDNDETQASLDDLYSLISWFMDCETIHPRRNNATLESKKWRLTQ